MKSLNSLAFAASLVASVSASAAVVMLDFEGIGDLVPVSNFYNGGAGGNLGVVFSPNAIAAIDIHQGGSADIANQPSGKTVMALFDPSVMVSYAAGFTTGLSFFFSAGAAGEVDLYESLDGTGTPITKIFFSADPSFNCVGGKFCNWTAAGGAFTGIARSAVFVGDPFVTLFDNVTFGSATPLVGGGGNVPEPTSIALVGIALAGLGAISRRRVGSGK